MFSKSTIAGAAALLAAPILVIAGTLAQPTLSDDAARKVAALTSRRGPMIAGMTLSMIAVVLLIAGTAWLALTLAPVPRAWRWPAACSACSACLSSCWRTASAPPRPPSSTHWTGPRPQPCSTTSTPARSRRSGQCRWPAISALPCSGSPPSRPGPYAGPQH